MTSPTALALLLAGLATSDMPPIHLADAPNFRDIGGYRTVDGLTVKPHLVFRSGELSALTEDDFKLLGPLQIRYVFDFRTAAERALAPTHWPGEEPQTVDVPIGIPKGNDPAHSFQAILASHPDAETVKRAMQMATAEIAIDGAPQIGAVIRSLADGQEPAILHCTAGKDRTGVATAILLTLLGVPRETVTADYLRSNEAAAALGHRYQAGGSGKIPGGLPPLGPEAMKLLLGVDASYLDAAFQAINDKYGSFDAYVTQGLQITPAQIAKLRETLLGR